MAGRYKKKELLGSGAFGKAWLVVKEETSRSHVMKEIFVKGLTDKEKNQALTEAEVLAKCKHLNIVRYKDAFIENGALNIVMEHAENGDLQKKIDTQNGIYFQEKVILDWFVQICFGLKYIHGLNILHRDLKTQNIFLSQDNIIKIGDFGISKMLQTAEDYANTAIGTPFYLSPEICEKKAYNNRSDMWALGCVLYNLCSLHHPFEAPDFASLVTKIVQAQFRPLPRHYSSLVLDLVKVLLRTDSDQRPTASQLLCVPAMQPYVNAYVKKSLAVRQHRIGSASPLVKHMYEKRRSSSPKPARGLSDDQRRVETPQRRKNGKEYDSPDENKENIDPQSGERAISNRPAWGTPRPGGLKNICQNIRSAEPVNRSSRTPGPPSPRLSLHREVLQRKRLHSDSPNRGSNSPPVSPRPSKDSQNVKKIKLTPTRPADMKIITPLRAKSQPPEKNGTNKPPKQSKPNPSKLKKITRSKTEDGKDIRLSRKGSAFLKDKEKRDGFKLAGDPCPTEESRDITPRVAHRDNTEGRKLHLRSSTSNNNGSDLEMNCDSLGSAVFADNILGTIYKSLVTTPKDIQKTIHSVQYHLELCIGKDKLEAVSTKLRDSIKQGKGYKEYSDGLEPNVVKYLPLIMQLHQLQQFETLVS